MKSAFLQEHRHLSTHLNQDMPAHLVYGDSYLASRALKSLEELVGPRDVLEANSHHLSGPQLDLAKLRAHCDAVPFLAEYRLVMVEGLLGVFEPRRRRGRNAPGIAGRSSVADWVDLPGYIGESMPPTTLLVFVEGEVSKGNPLLAKLRSAVEVQELPTPKGEALARWIRNRLSETGVKIAPGAIRLLSQFVGSNLWTLNGELEKLAIYVGDRGIEEADIRLLVPQAREENVFAAVDAFLEGKPAVALRLIHRLREEGAESTYILIMVARQLRMVTLARDLMDRNVGEKDIGQRLGAGPEFVVRKTIRQARSLPWSSLKRLYQKLVEADLAIKQGRLGQDLALDILIGESASAPPAARQRRRYSSPSSIQL